MSEYDPLTFKVFANDSKDPFDENTEGYSLEWDGNHFELTLDMDILKDVESVKIVPADKACWVTIDRQESEFRVGWKPMRPFLRSGVKNLFLSNNPALIFDSRSRDELHIVRLGGRVGYLNADNVVNATLNLKNVRDDLVKENEESAKRYHTKIQELSGVKPIVRIESADKPKTLKEKLKKAAKTVLGKNKKPVDSTGRPLISYDQTPIGSVDCFVYLNGVLHSYGWIYDMNSPIQNLYIAYYYDGELVVSHSCDTEFRNDVAQVIGIPEAVNSGFTFETIVESEFPLQVYAEYITEKGQGVMFLGDLPADPTVIGTKLEQPEDPRNIGCITDFMEKNTVDYLVNAPEIFEPAVDIIMPVYNAFDYFDKLFDSLDKTSINYKLIMINDCSPDERVMPYLQKYAAEHKNTILLENEQNLGFVKTVNRGLKIALEDNAHAVLLNTDVEVTDEWLERLIAPIITEENVASATPFTNSGTICSFPNFCKDNVLFENLPPWKIDNAFRFIKPLYPSMPSGIGFCMAMNVEAIRKVGLLDADTFGKGYGEENDWCQRAIRNGFRNVHVDNLFVYHNHGGSFPSEEKKRLNKENSEKLFARYPDYKKDVAAFCAIDPVKSRRLYVQLRLMNLIADVHTTVAFDHGIGGGATSYLEGQCKERIANGERFIIIRYIGASEEYKLIYRYKKNRVELSDARLENVLDSINHADEIWINELVTYPNLQETAETILKFRDRLQARLCFKLHDFFCICPAVTLVDEKFKYCDIAESVRCNECIKTNENALPGGFTDIAEFRKMWESFLQKCDVVTAFSKSSEVILKRAYPSLNNTEIIPHKTSPLDKPELGEKKTETFNIGILGAINENKGRIIIDECVEEIERTGRKDHICLIGYANKEYDSPAITVTGAYKRDEVAKLVEENDIDVFIIPSIWPETFSYTSSEIMSMDIPLAVFNLGAPPERVKDYEKGLVLDHYEGPDKLLDALEELGRRFR